MPALTVYLVAEETFDVDDEEINLNIGDEIINDDKNIKLYFKSKRRLKSQYRAYNDTGTYAISKPFIYCRGAGGLCQQLLEDCQEQDLSWKMIPKVYV